MRQARVWPWVSAAAALWATTTVLDIAATAAVVGASVRPEPDRSAAAIAELAEALGGDGAAQRVAEHIVIGEMARDEEVTPTASISTDFGDQR